MIGQKLGSFRIESQLGTGAMGVVYRAVHEATGRPAAIKLIIGENVQKAGVAGRFQREADILKQFRHPNIVRFLAVGRSQGISYFAMEYISGSTLEQVLEKRGVLPWQEVVSLGLQLCDALHYAHERGVVHRDLKPSNLMLTDKGQLKLTDFGIAKDLDATALTATGRTLGTAAYMAPEQIRGTPEVSHKTDLYALGIVLYQMLTGETPFKGKSAVVLMHAHLTEPVPRPSQKVPEIPIALDKLVVELLAKEPPDRPWDAEAVAMKLGELREKMTRNEPVPMVWSSMGVEGSVSEPVTTTTVKKTRKKSRKKTQAAGTLPRGLETALLLLALAAILGFAGYMLWPPSQEYLYRQAAELMATANPDNWRTARDRYLDPLDHRFPAHPHQEQTRAWRDQILLDEVQGRASVLERGLMKPRADDASEGLFVSVFERASEALKNDHPEVAAREYRAMAEALAQDQHSKDRRWFLLAQDRADQYTEAVTKWITQQLAVAKHLEESGRRQEALPVRRELVDRFGSYPEYSELLIDAQAGLLPQLTPPPSPSPTTPSPSAEQPPTPPPETKGEDRA